MRHKKGRRHAIDAASTHTDEAPKQRDRGFSQLAMWEVLPEHAAASLFANAFRKKKAQEQDVRGGAEALHEGLRCQYWVIFILWIRRRASSRGSLRLSCGKMKGSNLSSRSHGDPVMTKRQAMARAASKILTPRSWGKKYAPRSNLDAMAEGDEEEESDG